jgi:flagellar FliL protein
MSGKPAAKKEEGHATEGGGSKKKLIIIIAAVLSVVLIGGGGAFFMMKKKADAEAAAAAEDGGDEEAVDTHDPAPKKEKKKDKKKKEHGKAEVFAPLEDFTVNLADKEQGHYLRVGIVYEVEDEKVAQSLKEKLPKLRSNIMLLVSSKNAEELQELEGKKILSAQLIKLARKIVLDDEKDETIIDVHFSSFIIQ